jgi:hypothetical protein
VRLPGARLPAVAAAAVVLAVALSGCAQSSYTYVSNSDRDFVLRIPRTWSQVSTAAVLKADGTDTSTTDLGWLVFYDAAATPSTDHVRAESVDSPVMIAQSFDVDATSRASLTTDALRNIMEPVTADARASDAATRETEGLSPRTFKLISDQTVSTKLDSGVHEVFSYTTDGQTEYYDQIAVTDPKKTKAHFVLVHCSSACYQADQSQITAAVNSFTVKKA